MYVRREGPYPPDPSQGPGSESNGRDRKPSKERVQAAFLGPHHELVVTLCLDIGNPPVSYVFCTEPDQKDVDPPFPVMVMENGLGRPSGSLIISSFMFDAKAIKDYRLGSVGRCPQIVDFALKSPIKTILSFV